MGSRVPQQPEPLPTPWKNGFTDCGRKRHARPLPRTQARGFLTFPDSSTRVVYQPGRDGAGLAD
jgi:hypothetical protein